MFAEAARQQEAGGGRKKSEAELENEFCETAIEPTEMIYEISVDCLKGYTGLVLSNVELAGLRQIAEKCHNEAVEFLRDKIGPDGQYHNTFGYASPVTETIAQFLLQYYGIDEPKNKWHSLFEWNDNKEASDRVKEWFRIKQEEAHKV